MRIKPEEQAQGEAQDEAGDDGKIKRGVLAAMNDVARQAAKAERQPPAEVEHCADDNKQAAENEQHSSKITEGVHEKSVRENNQRSNEKSEQGEERSLESAAGGGLARDDESGWNRQISSWPAK